MLRAKRWIRASRACSRLPFLLKVRASRLPFQHTAKLVGQVRNRRHRWASAPIKRSPAALPLQQFPWFDEIHQVEMQSGQDMVRHLQGENPLAFEHIVQVRLRNTGQPGETPLGGVPAANEGAKMGDKPPL
jgi:hypothetical protein